ncbi:MAG: hypothetical protein AAFY60_19685, partial [Myxococcota bacterium]
MMTYLELGSHKRRALGATVLVAFLSISCESDSPGTSVDDDPPLGSDAPVVRISAPVSNTQYAFGEAVAFEAIVASNSESVGELDLRWSSSIDGVLDTSAADTNGISSFVLATLLPGDHAIALSATDSDGRTGVARIGITVLPADNAPMVAIIPESPTSADALLAEVT